MHIIRIFCLTLLFALTTQAQTIVRDKTTKEVIRKSATPLRLDGKLPADLDPSLEVLVEYREEQPAYDKATHKIVATSREEAGKPGEPINLIHGWQIVPLTQAELDAKQAAIDDAAERIAVKAMIQKLKDNTATAAEQRRCLIYLLKQLR